MQVRLKETPIEVLRRRARSGARDDGCHLSLVIEGGGMRGVVSGGMVTALQESELLPMFDSLHGSSAGACAAAYLLADQAALGTSIYYEDINNKKFIDVSRMFLGRAVMDTSFLIDYVMREIKILDVAKILARPGFLHIVVTNADTGKSERISRFRDENHFFSVLKASITMPIIGGRWVDIDGKRYVDGGMTQQIPVRSAIESGATHIVALLTRKMGELERRQTPWVREMERAMIRSVYGRPLAEVYMGRVAEINQVVAALIDPSPGDGGPRYSAIVRPADSIDISRLSTDAVALRTADRLAREALHRAVAL